MILSIKWNKRALKQFDDLVKYIEEDSLINAEKVKLGILIKLDSLLKHPEKYNPDKYKTNNDGSFRAFELYHYRISYRFVFSEIRIIRIRHTKMNPLKY
jgi:plasmid stabilization system protein ParE